MVFRLNSSASLTPLCTATTDLSLAYAHLLPYIMIPINKVNRRPNFSPGHCDDIPTLGTSFVDLSHCVTHTVATIYTNSHTVC